MWAQDGLNWFVGLTNLGGGFVLAAVILMLHRDSLKAFREELSAERTVHTNEIKLFLEMKLKHHEIILTRLATIETQVVTAQAALLEKIKELLDRQRGD